MYLVNKSLFAVFVRLPLAFRHAYQCGDNVEEGNVSKHVEGTEKKGFVYKILTRNVEKK